MTFSELQKIKQENGIIGQSAEIDKITEMLIRIADSDLAVLLTGESGTGKEVFAGLIHRMSKRKSKDFVAVNCGAIPENLIESELFGHKRGAFTSAVDSHRGFFEAANGGTLFLDEIGEMPLLTQVKLLRALENGEIRPVGSEKVLSVDVRVVAATNRDLQREVEAKRFRQDLYFRLKMISVEIPPLRKRKQDIPLLTDYFLQQFSKKNGRPVRTLSREAEERLLYYDWPGNIRELKNAVEAASQISKYDEIPADAFHLHSAGEKNPFLPVALGKSAEEIDKELLLRGMFELKRDINEIKEVLLHLTRELSGDKIDDDDLSLTNVIQERKKILSALEQAKWHKRKAARLLGISERTFYRKLKKHGIGEVGEIDEIQDSDF